MLVIKYSIIVLISYLLFGCTAVKVKPVDVTVKTMNHVCIKDGKEMCFDGDMLGVIRDGFERHGISTQVYSGNLPKECKYHLAYMCNQTWDMAMYMHHAELRLYENNDQIGYAQYHLNGGGGFSLMKWQSAKTKMDPVIDDLLKHFPIVDQDVK